MPSFSNKKRLRFIITLSTGKFGSSNNNVITLDGFRSTANIDKAGGVTMSTLRAQIYGVSQQDMNSVTTLQWRPGSLIKNTVEVIAIDGNVETLIFSGNIINAWADYQSMPDVFLQIQSQSAFFNSLESIAPRSFKGNIDVATVVNQIATDLGYNFENNGVNVQLTDVYLANTGLEQIKDLIKMANCSLYIDDKTLAITPLYGPRNGVIPVISAASGLIGYPTFDSVGVNFRTLFNPAVTFGGSIKLQTDVQQAAGEWIVTSIAHNLDAEKPDGNWSSTIRGNANGLAIPR